MSKEAINHPNHYGGDTTYEAIKVIEAWDLGFCLGNLVKYVGRAGKKDKAKELEDLKKAAWYLDRHIANLEHSGEPVAYCVCAFPLALFKKGQLLCKECNKPQKKLV